MKCFKMIIMNKNNSSKNYVDENRVRLVAAQVVILTIFSMITGWELLALFMAIDFALRVFTRIPSVFGLLATGVSKALKMEPKPIFAPPKKFAAFLGFIFSIGISVFFFIDLPNIAYIIGVVLALCAILESAFNICLGCYIYNWVIAPFVNMRNA